MRDCRLVASGTAITWIGGRPLHFEVLVEDKSGSIALEAILEKILGPNKAPHSRRIHPYKGLGRIPKDLRNATDPKKRVLLDRLPNILQGYGKSLQPFGHSVAVIVVVDLDAEDCMKFKRELLDVLKKCDPRPTALFRIAIEEIEAWLLGDRDAVKAAYPRAKDSILESYIQDSACGTWEVLADAVHPGGSAHLKKSGYPEIGMAKCEWAERIALHMDVERNKSRSFQSFRDTVRNLASVG